MEEFPAHLEYTGIYRLVLLHFAQERPLCPVASIVTLITQRLWVAPRGLDWL